MGLKRWLVLYSLITVEDMKIRTSTARVSISLLMLSTAAKQIREKLDKYLKDS